MLANGKGLNKEIFELENKKRKSNSFKRNIYIYFYYDRNDISSNELYA